MGILASPFKQQVLLMSDSFSQLSSMALHELHELVQKAERALEDKKKSERNNVIKHIKELAASIGVTVTISEGTKPVSIRKGAKVAPKYRNPSDHNQTWTGRGVKPRWLSELVKAGRRIDDFKI